MVRRKRSAAWLAFGAVALAEVTGAGEVRASFEREVRPVLEKYCFECHGGGIAKGGVTLDDWADEAALREPALWERVRRNVRTRTMPPAEEAQPEAAEVAALQRWIVGEAWGLDPARPDPGRPTVRRLNRVEYRNTVRDLTGVDFDTAKEFPADDTGHGFDTVGEALNVSPLLLERYLDAAQTIVEKFVPRQARVPAERTVPGNTFTTVRADTAVPPEQTAEIAADAAAVQRAAEAAAPPGRRGRPPEPPPPATRPAPRTEGGAIELSYYTPATVQAMHRVERAGRYLVVLEVQTQERYVDDKFDLNKGRLSFRLGEETLLEQEFAREGGRRFEFPFERELAAGEHTLTLEMAPVAPARVPHRNLRLRVHAVHLRGPLEPEQWVKPKGYEAVFPRDPPAEAGARTAYARELLARFAARAYRRPPDAATLDRLAAVAEAAGAPPATFEAGIAQAYTAVLASPGFLYREEGTLPVEPGETHPRVDEYALASRLSYFLWSTMPDAELFRLAGAGRLRAELPRQLERMLADRRAEEFVRNFAGQWLRARDIANVTIAASDVYLRDHPHPELAEARATFRRLGGRREGAERTPEDAAELAEARRAFDAYNRIPKPELTGELRRAMREETERTFAYVLREDRSLHELLDADYTFLNEDLAKHYGIPGVSGKQMRKVTLPPDSPRGGVLTQGTVLATTSNPTRTSPVKRGVFILESILGTPPAPPPPDVPALEEAAPETTGPAPTLRESLDRHARDPLCRSCHSRMDPLGLALENFNALGQWRTSELGRPVEPAGRLGTGEAFTDIRDLKRVLATAKRNDFYHCLTEKLLTYALGRAPDWRDTTTVERIVADLEAADGRPSALLRGVVESAAFQRRRAEAVPAGRVTTLLSERPVDP